MTPQVSAADFNPSEIASLRLAMRPGCLCGAGNVPMALWTPARYDVENLPPCQQASIYLVAGGWNIKRLINGIEFRHYKPHPLPEEALRELQTQIDQETTDLRALSPAELQRRMKRYRITP
jgi:hypothetical protein